jgi:hypothetical protein
MRPTAIFRLRQKTHLIYFFAELIFVLQLAKISSIIFIIYGKLQHANHTWTTRPAGGGVGKKRRAYLSQKNSFAIRKCIISSA